MLALNYIDYNSTITNTIKPNIDPIHISEKQHLDIDYYEGQPRSLYISESGLYRLMTKSVKDSAISFTNWIFDDVLPKVRKYGKYKLKMSYENEMYKLSRKISFLEKQNKLLKSDMKNEKFPDGGLVYVIDYTNEFGPMYRIGMTTNMNARKRLYKTHSAHDHQVVMFKETQCPVKLETCIRAMLYDYRYQKGRDFYECSLKTIKKAFKECYKSINKCISDQVSDLCSSETSAERRTQVSDFCSSEASAERRTQVGGHTNLCKYTRTSIDDIITQCNDKKTNINSEIAKLNKKLNKATRPNRYELYHR